MLEYTNGDAIQIAKDKASHGKVCLPHVCNNQWKWGKGFVLALSRAWPAGHLGSPETLYRCSKPPVLGEIQIAWPHPQLAVANMIAQQGVGGLRPLHYGYLAICMREVADRHDGPIVCPMFGAGLGGGDWRVIEELIVALWKDREVTVVQYA